MNMTSVLEKAPEVTQSTWLDICLPSDLVDSSGICALLPVGSGALQEVQVAIFWFENTNQIFALSNWDPFGKANVMYRGIVGSIDDEPMVASPLYKQHYSLVSGNCFEQEDLSLSSFPCRIEQGKVQLALTPQALQAQTSVLSCAV